jgi:undecaprenyl-diphosphatase
VNYQIVDALNDLSGHVDGLDDVVEFLARDLIYLAFAIFALLLVPALRRRSWLTLGQVGATLVLAYLFGLVAAALHSEQRPFTAHHDIHLLIAHPAGQSFPSDHATASFAMALAIGVFVSRKWGWVLGVMAAVIGLARVYAGLHYLGDIVGSLAVAALAVAVVRVGSGLTLKHLATRGAHRRRSVTGS